MIFTEDKTIFFILFRCTNDVNVSGFFFFFSSEADQVELDHEKEKITNKKPGNVNVVDKLANLSYLAF